MEQNTKKNLVDPLFEPRRSARTRSITNQRQQQQNNSDRVKKNIVK